MPDISYYSFWDLHEKADMIKHFYKKIAIQLARKIVFGDDISDNAAGIIAAIQTEPKFEAIKKEFLKIVAEKWSEQYLKNGSIFNKDKYGFFFSEEAIKSIDKAILHAKIEHLNLALSVLAEVFDFTQMANLNLECEEGSKEVQVVFEEHKTYILGNVAAGKQKIVKKIYDKAKINIESSREFLLSIFNNQSELAKEFKIDLEAFLSIKPGKISYNEHQAAVYRVVKDIAKLMPNNDFINKLLVHNKDLYIFDNFSETAFKELITYKENYPYKITLYDGEETIYENYASNNIVHSVGTISANNTSSAIIHPTEMETIGSNYNCFSSSSCIIC